MRCSGARVVRVAAPTADDLAIHRRVERDAEDKRVFVARSAVSIEICPAGPALANDVQIPGMAAVVIAGHVPVFAL
ncbi:hypothetical protein XM53_04040 [Roseovarius atlanticus]|uniref:Uncharacterized protein n=1 Tax=Roseovarius atlanticus TaxID=1641875 RepID=A0A0T5NXV3_9RHOB|nr:hypothetical protein XM53_04040 [Roseovarius atlanticus]